MVKRNVRRRTRRPRRTRRTRTRGRKLSSVRPKNARRRLQGKNEALRTAIAVGSGLHSAYEASKTVYDAIHQSTGVGKRTRKRAAGSRTRTKSKDNDGTGPYQQWSQRYAQGTFGKLTMNKLINKEYLLITHQNFTRFNQGRGAYFLAQYTDAASNSRFLPFVCWDLTSTPNHTGGGGGISTPAPMSVISKSTSAATDGNIQWKSVVGKDMLGSSSMLWQVEQSEHGINQPGSYPGAQSVLQWVSVEFELWGQQQYHTKYTIELCQMHEDVVPDTSLAVTATGGPYEMFWDNHMKSYTYSPLYSGSVHGFRGKKMKVWKRYNVDIDPTSTTETNADPHCKTFRMFFKFNRRCDYGWRKAGGAGQNIAEFDDADQPTEINANELTVHPSARIYLNVRATDFNVKASAAELGVANTPSISWKIRAKHALVN